MKKKYNITKEVLYDLYIVNHKTINEIAIIFKCCSWVIRNRLIKYEIPRFTTSQSTKIRKTHAKECNSNWKGGKDRLPKCLICNKILSSMNSKYCNTCKGLLLQKELVIKYCIDCGKQLAKSSYHTKSQRCYSCSKKGELSSCWILDRSQMQYPLGWTNTFKEQIRFRDNYTCQKCHTHEVDCSCKLHIHHIDYDKENIRPENLISLCRKCHMRTNGNRFYWIEYFQNLIKGVLEYGMGY